MRYLSRTARALLLGTALLDSVGLATLALIWSTDLLQSWWLRGVLPSATQLGCYDAGADDCFLVADLRLGAATT